jgi:hypothetical protein
MGAGGSRDALFQRILSDWQSEIQFAVEAGVAPSLSVGNADTLPAAMVGISAVRRLIEQRHDMTSPVLTVGGTSGAYPAILLMPQEGADQRAPSLVVLFSGIDEGTQIATASTLPKAPARLHQPGDRALPAGYRPYVSPSLQPASPLSWDNVPFRAMEPSEPTASVDALPGGGLVGWLALLLVALLILGALAS